MEFIRYLGKESAISFILLAVMATLVHSLHFIVNY
jgi:hypothetical protein